MGVVVLNKIERLWRYHIKVNACSIELGMYFEHLHHKINGVLWVEALIFFLENALVKHFLIE